MHDARECRVRTWSGYRLGMLSPHGGSARDGTKPTCGHVVELHCIRVSVPCVSHTTTPSTITVPPLLDTNSTPGASGVAPAIADAHRWVCGLETMVLLVFVAAVLVHPLRVQRALLSCLAVMLALVIHYISLYIQRRAGYSPLTDAGTFKTDLYRDVLGNDYLDCALAGLCLLAFGHISAVLFIGTPSRGRAQVSEGGDCHCLPVGRVSAFA